MQAWWQRDQIISAFIIGSFSMSATLISMYVNGRRAAAAQATGRRSRRRRLGRRRYAVLFLAGLVAGGVGYRFGATTLGAAGMSVLGPGGAADAAVPTAYPDASVVSSTPIDARPAPAPATNLEGAMPAGPMPASPAETPRAPPSLSDWLHAEGMRIHYRYAERLPDACAGRTVALGNWVDGRLGVPVECVDEAWLVLDVTELVESGRLTRNVTHCFALRSEAGHWARHDLAPSPGLERVAIASRSDFWGSAPLGFRVLRTDEPDRVEFVNGFPRVYC